METSPYASALKSKLRQAWSPSLYVFRDANFVVHKILLNGLIFVVVGSSLSSEWSIGDGEDTIVLFRFFAVM